MKTRRRKTTKLKRLKGPTAARRSSTSHLRKQLEQRDRELVEALQQQTATANVLNVINRSTFDLGPVLETIIENATRLGGAEQGFIYRSDGELLHIVADHGTSPEFKAFREKNPPRPGDGSIIGRTALSRRIVHIPDIFDDPEYKLAAVQKLGGFRSLLSVPMLRGDILLGVIHMWRTQARPFTRRQIELVTSFAGQAIIAIENARLLNELRQRTTDLSEALEQQTATSEVLRVISGSPGELEPVFNAILENAVRICEAKFAAMHLCEGDAFRLVAMHNAPPAWAEYRRREPVQRPHQDSALGQIALTKQVAHIADITKQRAYAERVPFVVASVELAGFRAVLGVPMLKENELAGAINIYRQEAGPFTDKQVALLTNFAAQAVIAIENARLLNELRESLDRQTATADVLKVISRSAFDLQTVLDTLTESA